MSTIVTTPLESVKAVPSGADREAAAKLRKQATATKEEAVEARRKARLLDEQADALDKAAKIAAEALKTDTKTNTKTEPQPEPITITPIEEVEVKIKGRGARVLHFLGHLPKRVLRVAKNLAVDVVITIVANKVAVKVWNGIERIAKTVKEVVTDPRWPAFFGNVRSTVVSIARIALDLLTRISNSPVMLGMWISSLFSADAAARYLKVRKPLDKAMLVVAVILFINWVATKIAARIKARRIANADFVTGPVVA